MSDKDTAASPEAATGAKPRDYVLVQHLQRDAETRGTRASRGGHRRQGVLLDDGTRVRQRAYRYTEMSIATLAANHQSILEHVREGRLAVFSPEEKQLSYDEVVSLLKGKGGVAAVEEKSLKESIQENVSGVRDEEVVQKVEVAPRSSDATKPDMELSETLAAVDMAEEKKKLKKAPDGAHDSRPRKRSKS